MTAPPLTGTPRREAERAQDGPAARLAGMLSRNAPEAGHPREQALRALDAAARQLQLMGMGRRRP